LVGTEVSGNKAGLLSPAFDIEEWGGVVATHCVNPREGAAPDDSGRSALGG
jgi:hypothetical protein